MTKKAVFDQIEATKETTYLTAEQVAELKQVSLSTVKRATASGILKNDRVPTKRNQKRFSRRYRLEDVERWRYSNLSLSESTEADALELDPAVGTDSEWLVGKEP